MKRGRSGLRSWSVSIGIAVALGAALVVATPASADHPLPGFTTDAQLGTGVNSGGRNADWNLITTVATGNPHTDLDFFEQKGSIYASVGTLAAGPNAAGQTIIRLTQKGKVNRDTVEFVSGFASAECPSNPGDALGLQHDVEATPKGNVLFNTRSPSAVRRDAQLLLDATDNPGRCHDNGLYDGPQPVPPGGIEIIDITDVQNPREIGLTSHIGEAHTVNVDPKRPHIVYVVSSDAVTINDNGTPTKFGDDFRENRVEGDNDASDLDGFEIMDISSCMDFPSGTSIEEKRQKCRPKVFRYRWPSTNFGRGHTSKTGTNGAYGCHELEIYPNDLLTCGGGNAALLLNMRRVFNDRGTPSNYTDDTIRGKRLPCRVRDSTSLPPFATTAKVTDCATGKNAQGEVDLRIPNWLKIGAPSVAGVRKVGAAHHQGRGATGPDHTSAYKSDEDIDFNHETELTHSRRFLISTDERGGGVTPPGASCSPGVDNKEGNGGLHAYREKRLDKRYPQSPKDAFQAYARTPRGRKAIYRAEIHTPPEGTICTAHVFQQIPGQNRIFMGWYSQGTQVVDFIERPNGTFQFIPAGYFIPENANTWTSHIFKVRKNYNGTFTYWGATGDFNIGQAGRNAIDVYKVTLPRPQLTAQAACRSNKAIRGSRGNDALVGTRGGDIICGLSGNDSIRGRGGDDIIVGGPGIDTIKAGGRNDIVFAGAGSDTASGGRGKDQVRGGIHQDILDGNQLHDVLVGGGGNDSVRGNGGNDTIRGSLGADTLQGGTADDLLKGERGDDILKGFRGDDVLDGGPGRDACEPGRGRDRKRNCER